MKRMTEKRSICFKCKVCPYMKVDVGFTNLNQKEAKRVYTCGLGKFETTRKASHLPAKCTGKRLWRLFHRRLKRKESVNANVDATPTMAVS